jgi:hypothetical protein
MEIISVPSQLTLFQWGRGRIVPVKINQLTINEVLHDAKLNPIQAEVTIEMDVLSYNNLPFSDKGCTLFLEHQAMMEKMAEKVRKKGQFEENFRNFWRAL